MSEYSVDSLLMGMLEDASFYLMLVVMLLLLLRKNAWISLSAVGLFFYYVPYFMAILILPVVYKEGSLMTEATLVNHLTNGFAAAGILMMAFGFYKLVTDFEKSNTRRG